MDRFIESVTGLESTIPMLIDLLSLSIGLVLVLFSAGRLVHGVLAFARNFGFSPFLVSVVFLGFDPENLAVGAVGTYEDAAGIAIGTIVGSAMVAMHWRSALRHSSCPFASNKRRVTFSSCRF